MAQKLTDNATGAGEPMQPCTGKDRSRSQLLTVDETAGAVPPLAELTNWREVESIVREE
jgi:hypothetical protein